MLGKYKVKSWERNLIVCGSVLFPKIDRAGANYSLLLLWALSSLIFPFLASHVTPPINLHHHHHHHHHLQGHHFYEVLNSRSRS